jgi:hypothetical protein
LSERAFRKEVSMETTTGSWRAVPSRGSGGRSRNSGSQKRVTAVRRVMGRARSLAGKFAARWVVRPAKRTRAGLPPIRLSTSGGGLAIEMWRAEDDGIAVAERQLQADVFDQFAVEPHLDATEVRVDVHRRTVRLSGAVRTSPERALAELAAKRVTGVERVESEIIVVRPVAF